MAISFHPKSVGEALITGLSTDTKPASPTAGWSFLETDTGKIYGVSGGEWVCHSDESYATADHTHPGGSEAFPIGSVFISVVSTNPGTLLGYGTWSAFGAGRVLVGLDAGQTEFDVVEETGGAKTHTLTSAEMPSHTHTQDAHTHTQNSHNHTQDAHSHTYKSQTATTGAVSSYEHGAIDTSSTAAENSISVEAATATNQAATAVNQNATATNQNTGGGGAHNNLQPYIVVYMFKRTA